MRDGTINARAITSGPVTAPQSWEPFHPEPWVQEALCAETDPEAFFPEKGGSTRAAKKVCATCDVAQACLDYAMEHDQRFGIWGGLSERERRKLRRARNAA